MLALTTIAIVSVAVTAISVALFMLEDMLAARDRRRRVDDVFTTVHRLPHTRPGARRRSTARPRPVSRKPSFR